MDVIDVIRKSELFYELDDDECSRVSAICRSEEVESGAVVLRQGSRGDNIYVIEYGSVGIILEVGPMTNRQVQAAANLESFGWSAMVAPHTVTATVQTKEKTRLLVFPGEPLRELCLEYPAMGYKIAMAVARVVSKRLRQAYDQLLGVTSQD